MDRLSRDRLGLPGWPVAPTARGLSRMIGCPAIARRDPTAGRPRHRPHFTDYRAPAIDLRDDRSPSTSPPLRDYRVPHRTTAHPAIDLPLRNERVPRQRAHLSGITGCPPSPRPRRTAGRPPPPTPTLRTTAGCPATDPTSPDYRARHQLHLSGPPGFPPSPRHVRPTGCVPPPPASPEQVPRHHAGLAGGPAAPPAPDLSGATSRGLRRSDLGPLAKPHLSCIFIQLGPAPRSSPP